MKFFLDVASLTFGSFLHAGPDISLTVDFAPHRIEEAPHADVGLGGRFEGHH